MPVPNTDARTVRHTVYMQTVQTLAQPHAPNPKPLTK